MNILTRLGQKGKDSAALRRWLKLLHIIAAALWGGGSTSVIIVVCFFHPENHAELYAKYMCLFYIDLFVIGAGATGCFVTGVIYSCYTSWGFFKYWWITIKWVLLIIYMVVGTLWFMPWLSVAIDNAKSAPPLSPVAGETLQAIILHNTITIVHLCLVVLIMVLSVKKPFGKILRSKS